MIKRSFDFRDFLTLLAVIAAVSLIAAGSITANWWLARQYGTGANILPVWNGARAFFFEQTDPYSVTVMQQTQQEVYGRAVHAKEYPYALDVPFPLLLIFSPLALIPDPVWARAVWMLLSEIGLIALVLLALQLTEWRPKIWFQVLLVAFALTWFYSINALLDGSFSILLSLAVIGALFSLRAGNDEAAGMLLALASMKWETTLLLFLFVIISVYLARRWRVLAGYAVVWVVLLAAGSLLYPSWGWPYLRSVAVNWRSDAFLTPGKVLGQWLPAYGPRLALVIVSILCLILVLEWFSALRSGDFRRVTWAAAFSLALTPLLGFSTTISNLAPLIFSFVVVLPFAWERWEKRSYLILLAFAFLFFAFPLFIRWRLAASPILADGLIYLFLPVLVILALYWMRWYVVRPPRTWLDSARREIHR